MRSDAADTRWRMASRVLAAVVGGYAFSAVSVALLAVVLPIAGMVRSEAVILASMLGFLIYLAVLVWTFADSSLDRVWALLASGAVLAYVLMHALKHTIANA